MGAPFLLTVLLVWASSCQAKGGSEINYDHTQLCQERVLIVMHGRLRDRMFEQTLRETTKILARLSSRLLVTSCSVRVKSDRGETFLFDDPEWICNREITEWTRYLLWL